MTDQFKYHFDARDHLGFNYFDNWCCCTMPTNVIITITAVEDEDVMAQFSFGKLME